MIDLNLLIASDVIKLGESNVLYTVIGISAFAFTTVGSVLLKCFLAARKNRKRAREERKMVEIVVDTVRKDITKSLLITQDIDLDKNLADREQFQVVEVVMKGSPKDVVTPRKGQDVVDTPRLTKSMSEESLNRVREW